jgi:hypothetical protein
MRGRCTTFATVRRDLGLFRSTSTSTQISLTDEEIAAIERGETTPEEARAKALKEAGLSD